MYIISCIHDICIHDVHIWYIQVSYICNNNIGGVYMYTYMLHICYKAGLKIALGDERSPTSKVELFCHPKPS